MKIKNMQWQKEKYCESKKEGNKKEKGREVTYFLYHKKRKRVLPFYKDLGAF